MKKLTINKLVIISEKTRTANQFEFSQGKNLITSDKNTVGKSTLVKMILWAFGCKPKLDSSWTALGAKTAITFTIDGSEYCILRDGSQMKIRKGHDKYDVYSTISGEYSECVANMLSFKPIFKLKNSDNHVITTPDGYFMAYYLDQECWTKAWKSLEGLMHFNNATPDLVKTHSGLLTSEFFECKIEELNTLDRRKEIEVVNEQYHSALDIIHKECGAHDVSTFTIDEDLFALQNVEITKTLESLQTQQAELWSNLTKLYSRRNHLRKHISIEERNIMALSEDYTFATSLEHLIHCPICNSTVVNDVVERSGLMADRESCERILESHKKELEKIEKEISKQQNIYEDVRQKVDDINNRYIVESETKVTGSDAIAFVAEKRIQDKLKVVTTQQEQQIEQKNLEIKRLQKEQRGIKKRVDKETINSFFCKTLQGCQECLGLDFSSISEKVKSPTDYNKVLQGGAADKTRSILSYYAALYLLINHQNNEVVGPLIIDTPFQQEQSDDNETRIMTLIEEKLVDKRSCNQVFLCAKKDEGIDRYKQNAKVIELNDTRALLSSSLYSDCADMYAQLSK